MAGGQTKTTRQEKPSSRINASRAAGKTRGERPARLLRQGTIKGPSTAAAVQAALCCSGRYRLWRPPAGRSQKVKSHTGPKQNSLGSPAAPHWGNATRRWRRWVPWTRRAINLPHRLGPPCDMTSRSHRSSQAWPGFSLASLEETPRRPFAVPGAAGRQEERQPRSISQFSLGHSGALGRPYLRRERDSQCQSDHKAMPKILAQSWRLENHHRCCAGTI